MRRGSFNASRRAAVLCLKTVQPLRLNRKWIPVRRNGGGGGGIASTTASCDDGFDLGNVFGKGASSTPHATSRFDVAGNAAAKLVESCSKQRRMGASGSRATCTLRTKLTCHYDARLRRTESHGKLGGTPRPAAEGSYGTSSSQIPYELLEVHLGSLFSRTTNWLTSGEGNR